MQTDAKKANARAIETKTIMEALSFLIQTEKSCFTKTAHSRSRFWISSRHGAVAAITPSPRSILVKAPKKPSSLHLATMSSAVMALMLLGYGPKAQTTFPKSFLWQDRTSALFYLTRLNTK